MYVGSSERRTGQQAEAECDEGSLIKALEMHPGQLPTAPERFSPFPAFHASLSL